MSENAAFDPALAGGAVDTAVGVPKSREEMFEFYGFIRAQARDAESKAGEGSLEMPAGYMFKEPPRFEAGELDDPVEPYDRIFGELPDVSFRDHVWARFLRENAVRVFKLDT